MLSINWEQVDTCPNVMYIAIPRECFEREADIFPIQETFNIFFDDLYDMRYFVKKQYLTMPYYKNQKGVICNNVFKVDDFIILKIVPVKNDNFKVEKATETIGIPYSDGYRVLSSFEFEMIDQFRVE